MTTKRSGRTRVPVWPQCCKSPPLPTPAFDLSPTRALPAATTISRVLLPTTENIATPSSDRLLITEIHCGDGRKAQVKDPAEDLNADPT